MSFASIFAGLGSPALALVGVSADPQGVSVIASASGVPHPSFLHSSCCSTRLSDIASSLASSCALETPRSTVVKLASSNALVCRFAPAGCPHVSRRSPLSLLWTLVVILVLSWCSVEVATSRGAGDGSL